MLPYLRTWTFRVYFMEPQVYENLAEVRTDLFVEVL